MLCCKSPNSVKKRRAYKPLRAAGAFEIWRSTKLNPVVAEFLLEWLDRSALARFGQHLAHSSDALVRLWIRSQNIQLRLNLNNNNIFQVLCTL